MNYINLILTAVLVTPCYASSNNASWGDIDAPITPATVTPTKTPSSSPTNAPVTSMPPSTATFRQPKSAEDKAAKCSFVTSHAELSDEQLKSQQAQEIMQQLPANFKFVADNPEAAKAIYKQYRAIYLQQNCAN